MIIHTFTEADKQQRWFRSLEESVEKRLQKLREKNDLTTNSDDTAFLRGQIAEIKALQKDMGAVPIIKPKHKVSYT